MELYSVQPTKTTEPLHVLTTSLSRVANVAQYCVIYVSSVSSLTAKYKQPACFLDVVLTVRLICLIYTRQVSCGCRDMLRNDTVEPFARCTYRVCVCL